MNNTPFSCLNGQILPTDQIKLQGERDKLGIFETMKMVNQHIPLFSYHFARLSNGLRILKYDIPAELTSQKLTDEIKRLSEKNKVSALCRMRLSVFKDTVTNGMIYTIECFDENSSLNELNEKGYLIDIYPDSRKACDNFSNLKLVNHRAYPMAAFYANEHGHDDCLVLNKHGRIADTSIANVFLIKDKTVITPSLSEGCVAGVMRRYLLEKIESEYKIKEGLITIAMVLEADELFLTNAVRGIRWVEQFRNKTYRNTQTVEIYNRFVKTIWE